MVKYGEIIYDPLSSKAKSLLGKTVLATSYYSGNDTKVWGVEGKLLTAGNKGFCVQSSNGKSSTFPFIREVIYIPYRVFSSVDELRDTFITRFKLNHVADNYSRPSIWVRCKKSEPSKHSCAKEEYLITGYDCVLDTVLINRSVFTLEGLFRYFTF